MSYESLQKINLGLRSSETGNLSADNFKNTRPRWVDTWARGTVRLYWSADTLFRRLSIDHNIEVQLDFSWTPKIARKCESKHWFPLVWIDGRSLGRCTIAWLPNFLGWVDLLSYGAPPTRGASHRPWISAIKCFTLIIFKQRLGTSHKRPTLKYPKLICFLIKKIFSFSCVAALYDRWRVAVAYT